MSDYEGRPSKEAWVLGEDKLPVKATGYQCLPASPDHWWFPAIGYSIWEPNIFETEEDAALAAIPLLTEQRDALEKRLMLLGRHRNPFGKKTEPGQPYWAGKATYITAQGTHCEMRFHWPRTEGQTVAQAQAEIDPWVEREALTPRVYYQIEPKLRFRKQR